MWANFKIPQLQQRRKKKHWHREIEQYLDFTPVSRLEFRVFSIDSVESDSNYLSLRVLTLLISLINNEGVELVYFI